MPKPKLSVLTRETWGERVYRAFRRKGITVRDITYAAQPIHSVGASTVARLYQLDEAPAPNSRQAFIAGLALAAAGYDPADFGLPTDDHLLYMQPKVIAVLRDNLKPSQPNSREQIRSYLASTRWGTAPGQIAAA